MAMEALFSNEIFNFILHDTTPYDHHINSSTTNNSFPTPLNFLLENPYHHHHHHHHQNPNDNFATYNNIYPRDWSPPNGSSSVILEETTEVLPVQGRKKRRRRSSKLCKNKEEAESQRMTHIAVERNRRKLMNEHLAVLRSLMPESYAERGDQASIVGGAITFVKELEHILQTLEAKQIVQSKELRMDASMVSTSGVSSATAAELINPTPFSQFFAFPQYSFCSQMQNKYTRSKTNGGVADIEVTLTESHANIRALCQRRLRQLTKLLSGFHSVYLTILHLNVTTLDPLVLYSISAKVEERCQLKSADEIAAVVNQMLKMIAEDAI